PNDPLAAAGVLGEKAPHRVSHPSPGLFASATRLASVSSGSRRKRFQTEPRPSRLPDRLPAVRRDAAVSSAPSSPVAAPPDELLERRPERESTTRAPFRDA